jgi:hypothetical protein
MLGYGDLVYCLVRATPGVDISLALMLQHLAKEARTTAQDLFLLSR